MSAALNSFLGLGHIALGAALLVAPFATTKMLNIDQTAQTAFITRACGNRDIILGAAIQFTQRQSAENKLAVLACAGIHAIDVVNGVASYVQGYLTPDALVGILVADGLSAALSWWEYSS
jgi:hypothetical protein